MDPILPIDVNVQLVKQWQDQGEDFLLLDCREPEEHQLARIGGSLLIPMQQIPERIAELVARNQRIVVHCHHGARSLRVTHWLRGQGFSRAQNMEGGIDAWSQQIDPGVPRY
jgi:rhodanese-related sulfurtransferase